jgi:hypothetical protein
MMESVLARVLPDEGGEREVFDGPLHRKPRAETISAAPTRSDTTSASPNKVYPLAAAGSTNKKNSFQAPTLASRETHRGLKSLVFQAMTKLATGVCLGWTLWLILLNVAPNNTVNRVMKTENFDYGSLWLMVDPSKTLMGFATFGLSTVGAGYLAVLVKMLVSLRSLRRAYLVRQERQENSNLMQKLERR